MDFFCSGRNTSSSKVEMCFKLQFKLDLQNHSSSWKWLSLLSLPPSSSDSRIVTHLQIKWSKNRCKICCLYIAVKQLSTLIYRPFSSQCIFRTCTEQKLSWILSCSFSHWRSRSCSFYELSVQPRLSILPKQIKCREKAIWIHLLKL